MGNAIEVIAPGLVLELGQGCRGVEGSAVGLAPPAPPPPPPPSPVVLPNPLASTNPLAGIDLGVDFDFFQDLSAGLKLVGGLANLGQALVHRLSTPRGGLFYDPGYGFDVRALLNETANPTKLSAWQAAIQAECLKDERIGAATCTLTFDTARNALTLALSLALANGTPFALIASVTTLTVKLLSISPAQ